MKTLRQFLSDLAADPQKMAEYLRDADAAMAAAGLSKQDQAVLKSASAATFTAAVAAQPQTTAPSFSFVHGDSIISIYVVVSPIAPASDPSARAALAALVFPPRPVRPLPVVNPPAIIRPATVRVVRPPTVRVPTVRPPSNGGKKKGR